METNMGKKSFINRYQKLVLKIYAIFIFLFAFVFAPFMWYQISSRLESFFVLDDAPSPLMFGLYLSVFQKYLPELAVVTVIAGIILFLLNKRH
jgi:TRAP-type C4-dicarboxylate transport system permease small subunit